jgi:predicted GTPase
MEVGHKLRSCTTKVEQTEPFLVSGREVVLLDTPGFDDTSKDDGEILEEIAEYLKKT